jgi:putative lipoprotein
MTLSGCVYLTGGAELPKNSTLKVSLLDVSVQDVQAKVLDAQTTSDVGTDGLGFELSYRPADVLDGHSYAISAQIICGDRLIYTTTEQHQVFLDGDYLQPQQVRVNRV